MNYCLTCGKRIEDGRKDKKFCTTTCHNRAKARKSKKQPVSDVAFQACKQRVRVPRDPDAVLVSKNTRLIEENRALVTQVKNFEEENLRQNKVLEVARREISALRNRLENTEDVLEQKISELNIVQADLEKYVLNFSLIDDSDEVAVHSGRDFTQDFIKHYQELSKFTYGLVEKRNNDRLRQKLTNHDRRFNRDIKEWVSQGQEL